MSKPAQSPPPSPRSPGENKNKPPRDQFHHFIPRFILRRYQVGPVLSKVERNKAYRRTGVDPEYVLYYDIEKQTLDTRPIGKIFGTQNMYRDARNSFNVNHLEEKLGQLEKRAAKIIRGIHESILWGKFTLTRPDLEALRKFLFLMHYRRRTMWVSLFDKDLPGNEEGRDRLEEYGKAKGLHKPADIWLHFLRYFLETPHEQINRDGVAWMKDNKNLTSMSETEMINYLGGRNFEAILYQTQAQAYFPGVWEAAEGEEFVLTPSAFGMTEGFHVEAREVFMHRLFILSPRLAIVLRNSALRPEYCTPEFRKKVASVLADYPLEFSEPTYANGRNGIPWDRNASPGELAQQLQEYRLSEQAQKDTFTFKIFKLTSEQTLNLNKAVLYCTAPTGGVTFTNKSFMVRSLRYYLRTVMDFEDMKKRPSYEALLSQLLYPPKPPGPPPVFVETLNEDVFAFIMSLVLRSSQTPPRASLYDCASTFVRQLPRLFAIGSDTQFLQDHRRAVNSVLAHLYRESKIKAADDAVLCPGSLDPAASLRLLEAARPLLRAAGVGCTSSIHSTGLERLLNATVVVHILHSAAENARLRTALRSECPALAAFLLEIPAPPPPNKPHIPLDLDIREDWPGTANEAMNLLTIQALKGNMRIQSRWEMGRTLHAYFSVALSAAPGEIKNPNLLATQYQKAMEGIITNAHIQLHPMAKRYKPRRNVQLKRPGSWKDIKDAERLITGAMMALGVLGYKAPLPTGEDWQCDLLNTMVAHAIAFGYLEWCVRNRQDMLDLLVQDIFEDEGYDISFVLEEKDAI